MKKSILVFSAYLPCKEYGGPVKSIYNLVENTSDKFDYYIISPDHDFLQKSKLIGVHEGWNKVGHANVLYVNEKEYNPNNIAMWINECHAQMVYLCSVFYYRFNFPAVKAAKTVGIPVLLAPRSDLLPNCIRLKLLRKLFFLMIVRVLKKYNGIWYHSTSNEETESILKWMSVKKEQIVQISNISSPPLNCLRKEKTKGSLKVVFIGRIHPRKNLKYAIECISQAKGSVNIYVYGTIEDSKYWSDCKRIASVKDGGEWLKYCGVRTFIEIQKVYYQYDCLFFPTLNENYGHVIVEAFISGCPVLLSKGTTPWDDYDGNGGFCYNLERKECFINTIEEWVRMNNDEFAILINKTKEYSRRKFDNSSLSRQYTNSFMSIINN